MSASGWTCLFFIVVASVVLSGELYIFDALPGGDGKQLIQSNLIEPLIGMIVLFVIGAIGSGYIWLRNSR